MSNGKTMITYLIVGLTKTYFYIKQVDFQNHIHVEKTK